MDYGSKWEEAWNEHVKVWEPPPGSSEYVYPQDMNLDEPFRTLVEQGKNPYPKNLMTVFDSSKHWPWGLTECIINKRYLDDLWGYTYDLYVTYNGNDDKQLVKGIRHDDIRFVDKPWHNDQFLSNGFRHPIAFPEHMTPASWKTGPGDLNYFEEGHEHYQAFRRK